MKLSVDYFSIGFMKNFMLQIRQPKEISWQVHKDKYKRLLPIPGFGSKTAGNKLQLSDYDG